MTPMPAGCVVRPMEEKRASRDHPGVSNCTLCLVPLVVGYRLSFFNSIQEPPTNTEPMEGKGRWTEQEHDRFLEGMKLYPRCPWKVLADHIGTRSPRQVQTHAQKYHQKIERRERGLRKVRRQIARTEHRIDIETMKNYGYTSGGSSDGGSPRCSSDLAVAGAWVDWPSDAGSGSGAKVQSMSMMTLLELDEEALLECTTQVINWIVKQGAGKTSSVKVEPLPLSDEDDRLMAELTRICGQESAGR